MIKNNLRMGYAYSVLGLLVLVMGVLVYWQFIQPSEILSNFSKEVIFNNSNSNVVEAGKATLINRSFCVHNTDYEGTVSRSFSNHIVYQLPTTTTTFSNSSVGCREKQYLLDIPSALPSGEYIYKVTISYKINPIKTVRYRLTPIELQVVNPVWDAAKALTEKK